MSDPDVQRDLGRMEAQIAGLTKQVEALTETVAKLSDELAASRGGMKVLLALMSAAGVVGGLVGKFAPMLFARQ